MLKKIKLISIILVALGFLGFSIHIGIERWTTPMTTPEVLGKYWYYYIVMIVTYFLILNIPEKK